MMKNGPVDTGTLVLTDHQTFGKGTNGRIWFSLPKPQLMFSILLQPTLPPQKLPIINVLCGILLAKTIEEAGIQAQVKWPNDVYIQGKKVAGILSELSTSNQQTRIILGIGVNTNAELTDFPTDLAATATALSLHSKSVNRFTILESFLLKLETALYDWNTDEMINFVQKQFEDYWLFKDKEIEIRLDQKILRGKSNGINASGALEFVTKTGLEHIYSGTIIDKPARNE